MCARRRVADRFAGVGEDVAEHVAVAGRQLVGGLGVAPRRERGVGFEVVADVGAAALDEVLGEAFAVVAVGVAGQLVGQRQELVVEQAEQAAERALLAGVRRGGHQHEVAVLVLGECVDELVALVAGAAVAFAGVGAGVGLVDDDEVGAGPDEVVAAAVALDEVDRHHRVRVHVEQRLAVEEAAFQAGGRRRQHELGVDVELLGQLLLPLLGQVRRAQHAHALRVALLQQLLGDQGRFDRLADADVVGDQQADRVELERHQQRHQLVRARRHADPSDRAERAGARAEPEPQRIAEHAGGAVVAEVAGIGQGERRRLDRFEVGEDAGDLGVGAAERSHHEQVVARLGQHHPLPVACSHQRTCGEAHSDPSPKTDR